MQSELVSEKGTAARKRLSFAIFGLLVLPSVLFTLLYFGNTNDKKVLGAHSALRPSEISSETAPKNCPIQVCAPCPKSGQAQDDQNK